jgi:hypothetical protein
MVDQSDDAIKPWTIKGIAPENRNAAIAAASREKQTLGEWISRAIRTQIQIDLGRERLPAPMAPRPLVDRAEVAKTVESIQALAATGAPVPKRVSRLAYGLLGDHLEALRGPAKRGTGRAPGPTQETESPTEPADSQTEAFKSQTVEAIDLRNED